MAEQMRSVLECNYPESAATIKQLTCIFVTLESE